MPPSPADYHRDRKETKKEPDLLPASRRRDCRISARPDRELFHELEWWVERGGPYMIEGFLLTGGCSQASGLPGVDPHRCWTLFGFTVAI
jgi:hypothetical protein